MALRSDWQKQLRCCHDELGFRYVRFHGLLSDDVGTLICHKENSSIRSSMPIRLLISSFLRG